MAMKFISSSYYWLTSNYTASRSIPLPTNCNLIICHYLRGNPVDNLSDNPNYAGVKFTRALNRIGVGSTLDYTVDMFYLMDPASGTNNFVFYNGTQGDPATVQNLNVMLIFASSSAGYGIELDNAQGTAFGAVPVTFTTTASDSGVLVFNALAHDNATDFGNTTNQTFITSNDFGVYTGYYAYAVTTGSGPITFNWASIGANEHANMLIAFREVQPNSYNAVSLIQDEDWTFSE